MNSRIFRFPVRVYYEDTDAGGVVYHARYLHFFERARTEYLRLLEFSQQTLLQEQQSAFVVKSMAIDYRVPAKLDDYLIIETEVSAIKGATILFEQRLIRDTVILSKATVKVAYVDLGKMKPAAIPTEIKAAFLNNIEHFSE
ncbi:MAG: tol-pal system-associated acyl-CoA thioesterase [Rodentibacter sp.]